MDLTLTTADIEAQARARAFAETWLHPNEIACDERTLSKKTLTEIKKNVLRYKLNGVNHTKEDGGHGYTPLQQILICEQLGRATNGMWTVAWKASTPLKYGTEKQRKQFLIPINQGKGRACYAITEAQAGSDPSMVKTKAVKKKGKWVISGEKWFVTSADASHVILVHAHVDGDPKKPTIFIVDKDAPGVKVTRIPKFTHNYLYEHFEMVFDKVDGR